MLGVRGPSSPSRTTAAGSNWLNAGYLLVSGSTDRNGTPAFVQYSNQRPPESASHGVPTASAAIPKPECGASRTSQASTTASCSARGTSTQFRGRERCASSASTSSRRQEVELRSSRASRPTRTSCRPGTASVSASSTSSQDSTEGYRDGSLDPAGRTAIRGGASSPTRRGAAARAAAGGEIGRGNV